MATSPPPPFRTDLYTHWGDGSVVAARWHAAQRENTPLNLVALSDHVPPPLMAAGPLGDWLAGVHGPGVHHYSEDGRLRLSLWVGEWERLLPELRLQADAVVLGDGAWATGSQALALCKALTRCAHRGTTLQVATAEVAALQALATLLPTTGWQARIDAVGTWEWNPPWAVKTDREPWRAWVHPAGRCAVVGAGIAGAAVAAALARQGWTVQVLDATGDVAAGASSLPVGLAAAYRSADDAPLSRLTRQGVHVLSEVARTLLVAGRDWAPSGAQELPLGGAPGAWSWQPEACWVKPRALVQAWMATAGVQFQGNAAVHSVQRDGAAWSLHGAQGTLLARADRVVLAVASGVKDVLAQSPDLRDAGAGRGWPPLHTVRGLVSGGRHEAPETRPFPVHPVHGNGSLVARVPFPGGERWFVGASYQPVHADEPEWPDDKNHGANALRLEKLAPDLFASLTPELESGALQAWKGQRCVTGDRMPLVGPVSAALPDVWVCAGFGSRGLSLVALCAELLAAQWSGRPWPLPYSLAYSLIPYRKRL